MDEKGKKVFFIGVIGIVVFIVLVSIVIVIKESTDNTKISNSEDTSSKTSIETDTTEKIENKEENKKAQELDIRDSIVARLYKYVLVDNSNHISEEGTDLTNMDEAINASFYKDSKVTVNNLSNIEKIIAVLQSFDDKDITEYNVKEQAEKVFGPDATSINWKNLVGGGTYYEYKDGVYNKKVINDGNALSVSYTGKTAITKAEKDDDYIYIYDAFIYVEKFKNGDTKYYNSSEMTKEISGKDVTELNTYKHTFKKSSSGLYYWVSTEIVK